MSERIVVDGKVLPPDLIVQTLKRMRDVQIAQAALDRLWFAELVAAHLTHGHGA